LPIQKQESSKMDSVEDRGALPVFFSQLQTAARIASSKTSSRMSIERYLSAPLEDEPASVPAINAALKRQTPQSFGSDAQAPQRRGHSRETSYDANSEGRRTFYTSGSAPDSTGTSYSVVSKSKRTNARPQMPELTKIKTLLSEHAAVQSPERPTTSRTIEVETIWTEPFHMDFPEYSPEKKTGYRELAEQELAQIQEKARRLEDQLRRFREEKEAAELLPSRVTDEMAYEQMAAKPKLAWILGGDGLDANSIKRPKSIASVGASVADGAMSRPSTSGSLADERRAKQPRKSKSIGALDDASGRSQPEKKPPLPEMKSGKRQRFFCTFCHKRFHSQTEWMNHEKTIHIPDELWVCCPRTGEFPGRCPFCEKSKPSPSHLADHNYLSCQAKPLSERTFSRKDHFLQHISQEHKVSPGQKPLRLTELLEAWRHPLPLKQGHQALHCGFCGLTFPTYQERTEHVAGHFAKGLDMMSWWAARLSHEVVGPQKTDHSPYGISSSFAFAHIDSRCRYLPHRCRYCDRTYENLAVARKLHPICTMWSCSFLPGMQYTIYPAGVRPNLEAVCCYCNESLVKGDGKVKGAVLKEHIAMHNFRNCNQRLYFSGQRFRQHLQDNHKASYDASLFAGWTLLLKSGKKERPAVFESVDVTALRRVYTDMEVARQSTDKNREAPQVPKMNFMDFSETPQTSSAPRKKIRRKASVQTLPESVPNEVRDSGHFFTRAATTDFMVGEAGSSSPRLGPTGVLSPKSGMQHKLDFPVVSPPVDGIHRGLRFYRRRIEASTRNRLYIRDEADGPLSKNSQKLFRQMPASRFGGLVLHSSLVGMAPAKLTNAIDIYSLH